jgi:hypothetical protein
VAGAGAILDGVLLYASLSGEGRRLARRAFGRLRGSEGRSVAEIADDPWQRRLTARNFVVCDRSFRRLVSPDAARAVGRPLPRLYGRLVNFARCNLDLRSRIFHAFRIPYGRRAEGRCVLHSFIHREWNDLIDEQGVDVRELFRAMDLRREAEGRLFLVRRFKQAFDLLVPRERFLNYYRLADRSAGLYPRELTRENARQRTAEMSLFSSLLATYVMKNEVHEALKEALPPLSLWLYSLDDLADLAPDAEGKGLTYMSTVADPEEEIWRLYRDSEASLRRLAPRPERVLPFMRVMTRQIIEARRRNENVEQLYFGEG